MRVVVIGAGPGGLYVAECCATAGHDVTVFDQRTSPARKFVLAGRGGLNITHSEPLDDFLDRYGPEREHLEAAVRGFSPDDLRAWVAGLGEAPFVGSSGRVFPASFRAVPLLRAWLNRLGRLGVRFEPGQRWVGWDGDVADRAAAFVATDGMQTSVAYDAAVLALGGASWPRVGSDGSWMATLREIGVDLVDLAPANCGVRVSWSPVMVERFAGAPVKNAAVIVDGAVVRGDPIITATGLEGGPIYAHSRRLRERLDRDGVATVELDLTPDLDITALEQRLVDQRRAKRSTSTWLDRAGLSPVGIALLRDATRNRLPDDIEPLARLIKRVPIVVDGLASIERAISSAGGVSWDAVDPKLRLRVAPAVHVVGEMLDWEAPTGGYLLQGVFSTAHLVGSHLSGVGSGGSAS